MTQFTDADVVVLSISLFAALVGIIYSWAVPGKCVCPLCQTHRQERSTKNPPARTQWEVQHEAEHKGFGFNEGDRDYMDCSTKVCPRNTHTRRIGP